MKRKLVAFEPGRELHEALEKKAEDEGVSVSELIRQALREKLEVKNVRLLKVVLIDGKKQTEIGRIPSARVGRG